MERTTFSVIVTWRESSAEVFSLGEDRFVVMRQAWIDEGYTNLQTEFYESTKSGALPDRFRVFAYWESPDEAPDLAQMREWGLEAIGLSVVG